MTLGTSCQKYENWFLGGKWSLFMQSTDIRITFKQTYSISKVLKCHKGQLGKMSTKAV